jgi:hypothetical protein
MYDFTVVKINDFNLSGRFTVAICPAFLGGSTLFGLAL